MSGTESEVYRTYILFFHLNSILGAGEPTDPKTPLGMKFFDKIVEYEDITNISKFDRHLQTRINLIPTEAAKKKYCLKILEKDPYNKLAQKITGIKPKDRLSPDEKEKRSLKIKDISDKMEKEEDIHTEYKEKYFLTEEDKRELRAVNSEKSESEQDRAIQTISNDVHLDVSKSICAFLNTEGGTLSIGVHDDGRILGVEHDFDTVKKLSKPGKCETEIQKRDQLKQRITTNVKNHIEKSPSILFSKLIKYEWEYKQTKSGKKMILHVQAREALHPHDSEWPLMINGAAYRREDERDMPLTGTAFRDLMKWGAAQPKKKIEL